MKLTIHENGDTSVGYPESFYEIDCPFEKDDLDEQSLNAFKVHLLSIYDDFTENDLRAFYDFEIQNE